MGEKKATGRTARAKKQDEQDAGGKRDGRMSQGERGMKNARGSSYRPAIGPVHINVVR